MSQPSKLAVFLIYGRAILLLLPALVCSSFSRIFLEPKLREIWEMAGITHAVVNGIMRFGNICVTGFPIALIILGVGFGLLETTVKGWPRFRGPVLDTIVLLVNTTFLLGVTAMSTSAMIVVPMVLAKSQ
jgi:hypothetical protein